ncbi:MAG: lactonase family protein [Mariniphaga sp.]
MKTLAILLLGFILLSNKFSSASQQPKEKLQYFFVGTYTGSGSEGIYAYSLNPASGKLINHGLAAKSNNPSFLTLTSDRKFLIAVNEVSDKNKGDMGYIESFEVTNDGIHLTPLSKVASGGADPCYVSVNQSGYILAANYSGGNVALFRLHKTGILSDLSDMDQHIGNGPNKGRQASPHVHSAFFEPGSNRIFVADLGIDKVAVYRLDSIHHKLIKEPIGEINIPSGSGPRHLAFHPTLKIIYVVNEITSNITVVAANKDDSFKILETVSALPLNNKQPNTCADIHISKDGRFLYASNRGFNSIAIFSVNSLNGKIAQIGQESTRGDAPRNFTLSPDEDFLIVGNQKTNEIVSFRRDKTTGKLQFANQIKAFSPVCLLFRNQN